MAQNISSPVLILDGNSLAALSFVRSLGRAGVPLVVADFSADPPVRHSKFCSEFLTYPSPLENPDNFRNWLVGTLASRRFELLIGTTDYTLPLLDEWRSVLESLVRLALPASAGFRLAYDKAATIEIAKQAGVAVPPTHFPESFDNVERLAQGARWPLVLKPRSSVLARGGSRKPAGVEYAWNAAELRARYASLHERSPWPMVQEYVSGAGVGCFFLIHEGRVLARFQHRRIRDKNPTGSGSCLRVSVVPDEQLMAGSERLLRAMGWSGLAMVEFKLGADSTAYLMEVNPRPWGSMQLAVEAGVDFPLLWYQAWMGRSFEPVLSYRADVQCRYLAGDISHLVSVLAGPPPGWRLPYPKRFPTVLRFLKFWGMRYDDFAFGDWRPGFADLRRTVGELMQRVFRKARRARNG